MYGIITIDLKNLREDFQNRQKELAAQQQEIDFLSRKIVASLAQHPSEAVQVFPCCCQTKVKKRFVLKGFGVLVQFVKRQFLK